LVLSQSDRAGALPSGGKNRLACHSEEWRGKLAATSPKLKYYPSLLMHSPNKSVYITVELGAAIGIPVMDGGFDAQMEARGLDWRLSLRRKAARPEEFRQAGQDEGNDFDGESGPAKNWVASIRFGAPVGAPVPAGNSPTRSRVSGQGRTNFPRDTLLA
jgi:hypothetical protein